MLLSTAPLMSMGWYCSPAPFKCMRLGCNTSHSLWTRMALRFLEESSHATFPPVSYMPFNGTTIRLQDCVNKPNLSKDYGTQGHDHYRGCYPAYSGS